MTSISYNLYNNAFTAARALSPTSRVRAITLVFNVETATNNPGTIEVVNAKQQELITHN